MANVMTPWQEMSASARAALVAGVALILALTVGAYFWLAGENYRILFTDLAPRDASAVVAELERLKIDYKLDQQSAQIMVPESAVHEVRLKLMGSGVPLVGGVGFEIFDNSDFGMTEFAQRINYQRALEGELTRTIMSLQEVKYARVHLVMPEKGLFQQQDGAPSASVSLFLKQAYLDAGRGPGPNQILGIQRLVAAAVPGLKAAQVTVTDQGGVTLSQPLSEQQGMAAVSERLQQKRAVETYLADKVAEVLVAAFGANQAMVSVDVELDFNEVKRTFENVVSPDNGKQGVVRRRETRLGNGAEGDNAAGNVTTEIEYRLGRTVEQIVESPGRILRLSVGVVVPADTNSERRDEIRQLVEMTVGLKSARGDAIAVYSMAPVKIAAAPAPVADTGAALEALPEPAPAQLAAAQIPVGAAALTDWIERRPWIVFAGGATALLVLLLLLFGGRRGKPAPSGPPVLSQHEREQTLARIQHWLEQSETPPRGEVS